MCEIFFQYSKNGEIDTNSLVRLLYTAVDEASHRNSDGFGVFNEEKRILKSGDRLQYRDIAEIVEEFGAFVLV